MNEWESIHTGQPVQEKYKKLLEPFAEGGILELSSDGASYFYMLGFSEVTPEEIDSFTKEKIVTRVIEPSVECGLPGPEFTSFFKFGRMGPMDVFFNPALYPQDRWREFAEKSRNTNTMFFQLFDRKTWIWKGLRFATMPRMWRKCLLRWWEYLADNPDIEQNAYIRQASEWVRRMDRVSLDKLWERGIYSGSFGEPISSITHD